MQHVRWNRMQSLFDVAVSLGPAERDAYLSSECGDDTELRHQIESLIAVSTSASGVLGGAVANATRELTLSVAIGQRVGPWELVRELGHGGMGAVFLARRADGEYEAQVAIKLIGGVHTSEHLRRFRTERQILAGLEHPNIARLVDGGSTPDGVPWVAMELVEGVPLDSYCDERGLTVERRIALFLDVCAAVQYAHRHLVVHRDIKPGNILVTAEGVPKLLDFGIAKLLDPAATDPLQTGTALRLMTPAYASPEQLRGTAVTVETDVYALGVVLYRILAGRLPHDLSGRTLGEIERLVCDVDPVRPSAAALDPQLGRRLRGDLDTIVLTALQKDARRRYPSVERLADDLQRHLGGLPVRARGDDVAYRARKFVQRHRWGVAVAAAAVVLLAGFAGAMAVQARRLAVERDAATLARANAEQIAAFLTGIFEVSDPNESKGESVTARELLDEGARRIQADLAGQPDIQAGMMRLIGDVYRGLGLNARALPLLEGALAQHRALYGDVHAEVATSKTALASLLQDMGDVTAAEPLFREALATRQALYGPEHPDVNESLTDIAYLLETNGDIAGAEEVFRTALDQQRRLYPGDDAHTASTLVDLGRLLRQTGRLDEAEPMLRDAVAIYRGLYGSDDPRVAGPIRNLAALLRDRGAFAEAETLYLESLTIRRTALGEVHPEVASTLNSYALLLDRMGERERAIAAFREFVDLIERIHGGPHPNAAAGYHNLASALRDVGRYDEALPLFRKALQVQDQVLAADHPNRAFPRVGMASVYMAQRRFAEAEPWLREALVLRRGLPAGHRYIGETLSDLGACLTELGRYQEAGALLTEAYAVLRAAEDSGASRLVRARDRLAELYRRTGQPGRAAELLADDPKPS